MTDKHARLDEISILLAKSNKAAKTAAEELAGPRKYAEFRQALTGKPVLGEGTMRLIAMLPESDKQLMLAVEGLVEELTHKFMKLLHKTAKTFAVLHDGFERSELLGVAWMCFRQAIFGYDDTKYKFVTYAQNVLQREMTRYCLENRVYGLASHSGEYLDLLKACLQAQDKLWQELEREPLPEDICEAIRPNFPDALDLQHKVLSILRPVTSDSGLSTDGSNVYGHKFEDYTDGVADQSLLLDRDLLQAQSGAELDGLLSKAEITGVARAVITARATDVPLKDIAIQCNITVARVKQLASEARKKLREVA